jgi:hypothetical protein
MAVIQVDIPEKLWERLQQTGRPIEEVVVEALEKAFDCDLATMEGHLSRQKIIRRLIESDTVIDPGAWDDSYAQAWLDRPERERNNLIAEMDEEWHPGSTASRAIIDGRR